MQAPHPDAILTRAEVAEWLKLKSRQVERLGIPCLDLGRRTKRYLAKDVLLWLEAKRVESVRPHRRRFDSANHSVAPPAHDGQGLFADVR
jgi:hypothetical protein